MSILGKLFGKKDKDALDKGLEKTRSNFLNKLGKAVLGKSKVDDDVLDEIEEVLISADVGVSTTVKIIEKLEARVAENKYFGAEELNTFLEDEISDLLSNQNIKNTNDVYMDSPPKPYVIMVVGVNGVGKTTTIGKLAHRYKSEGKKVVIGAGDTFRAAAVEQIEIWGRRVGVPVVKQAQGSDPASVAYDTLQSAIAQDADVVLIDTAGRLHNKVNLMNELTKVRRVMSKLIPEAPHETMLVIDASTGQNAFEQAKHFIAATEVSSLTVTKLDGTAKGGVVIGVSDQFQVPVKYIGVGEGAEHLQPFNPTEFVRSFFRSN
ncbi:MAG: signal recognition particle-docking protein FtsY [Cryomorphaceae bacterium]|nr:signal recognition particle-docking protein FtsY [Cryomorphaceae bacterium]